MTYEATKAAVKNSFDGIGLDFPATDPSELTVDAVKQKLKSS